MGAKVTTQKVKLGIWYADAFVPNTVYQAPTDGIICALASINITIQGFTDEGNPPLYMRASNHVSSTGGVYGSITFPVRKNDYWELTSTSAIGIFFLAIS